MNLSSSVSPREELAGLGVEVVELALEDRDHVPRHVVVDSGPRASPALASLLLLDLLQPARISFSRLSTVVRLHRSRFLGRVRVRDSYPSPRRKYQNPMRFWVFERPQASD